MKTYFSKSAFTVFFLLAVACSNNGFPEDIIDTDATENTTTEIPILENAIIVRNTSELNQALNTANGGEFIVLEDGNYGNLRINNEFPENVTLRSRNKLQAVFEEIDISNSNHVFIDGVSSGNELEGSESAFTTVQNSMFSSAIFKFSHNIVFHNNDVTYANFNDSFSFIVSQNYIHDGSADLLHIKGNAYDFVVENNFLYDTHPDENAHSDAIQMTGGADGTPHDFILRGNYVYDNPNTNADPSITDKKLQGFFLADQTGQGYYNVLIENNILNASNTTNTILVGGSSNIVVRNNTLLPTELSGGGIRVSEREVNGVQATGIEVTKNIAVIISDGDAPNANIHDNYLYAGENLEDLFENPNNFGTWRIAIPKTNSAVGFGKGYGAETRVQEMIDGVGLPSAPQL